MLLNLKFNLQNVYNVSMRIKYYNLINIRHIREPINKMTRNNKNNDNKNKKK